MNFSFLCNLTVEIIHLCIIQLHIFLVFSWKRKRCGKRQRGRFRGWFQGKVNHRYLFLRIILFHMSKKWCVLDLLYHMCLLGFSFTQKLKEDLEKERSTVVQLEKDLAEEKRLRAAAGVVVASSVVSAVNNSETKVRLYKIWQDNCWSKCSKICSYLNMNNE